MKSVDFRLFVGFDVYNARWLVEGLSFAEDVAWGDIHHEALIFSDEQIAVVVADTAVNHEKDVVAEIPRHLDDFVVVVEGSGEIVKYLYDKVNAFVVEEGELDDVLVTQLVDDSDLAGAGQVLDHLKNVEVLVVLLLDDGGTYLLLLTLGNPLLAAEVAQYV